MLQNVRFRYRNPAFCGAMGAVRRSEPYRNANVFPWETPALSARLRWSCTVRSSSFVIVSNTALNICEQTERMNAYIERTIFDHYRSRRHRNHGKHQSFGMSSGIYGLLSHCRFGDRIGQPTVLCSLILKDPIRPNKFVRFAKPRQTVAIVYSASIPIRIRYPWPSS